MASPSKQSYEDKSSSPPRFRFIDPSLADLQQIQRSMNYIKVETKPIKRIYFYQPQTDASNPQYDIGKFRSLYHDEKDAMITELYYENGQLVSTNRVARPKTHASHLLEQFCHIVELPVDSWKTVRVAAITLAQCMAQYLKKQPGKHWPTVPKGDYLPHGILGIQTAKPDPNNAALENLVPRSGWKVERVDTAAFVRYTFHPPISTLSRVDGLYRYTVFVDMSSEALKDSLFLFSKEQQAQAFELVVLFALHIYNRMHSIASTASASTEDERLRHTICRGEFMQLTEVADEQWRGVKQDRTLVLKLDDDSHFITAPGGSVILPANTPQDEVQTTIDMVFAALDAGKAKKDGGLLVVLPEEAAEQTEGTEENTIPTAQAARAKAKRKSKATRKTAMRTAQPEQAEALEDSKDSKSNTITPARGAQAEAMEASQATEQDTIVTTQAEPVEPAAEEAEEEAEELSSELNAMGLADNENDDTADKPDVASPETTSSGSDATVKPPPSMSFRFDSSHPDLICRLPSCSTMTSSTTSSCVICPACGPSSFIRYCTLEHLYNDIRRHHLSECGRCAVTGLIDRSTLNAASFALRPYMHPIPGVINTVERHRQAVYYAMEPQPAYYLFDDLSEATLLLRDQIQEARGTGDVLASVRFEDPNMAYFEIWIGRYLMAGQSTDAQKAICESMAALIRRKLIDDGLWDDEIVTRLMMQMGFEVGWRMPEYLQELRQANER